ncbi:MAG: hypothetical protein MI920_37005 [Kiloniellales bacterium]|nr:hypothetical protein [Kiloniellales bacterium]
MKRPVIGFLGLIAIAVAPTAALADPLASVVPVSALVGESVVVDESTLSGIRGRGAEFPDPTIIDHEDVAVILWDELKRPGQSGSNYSQTSGNQNIQSSTLSATRY